MTTALQRLLAVAPALTRVRLAGEALHLAPLELLHAGPPLRNPQRPPAVLLSSAVVTCVHEGWAASFDEAESMIAGGEVRLSPAQERGCVVPLAFVVSSGTPLFEVSDGAQGIWAPVSTVRGADTRMGFRDPGLQQRLSERNQRIAPAWRRLLARSGAIPLLPLAAHGLANGDDLHSRTAAANAALVGWMRKHDVDTPSTESALSVSASLADDVEATPLFFLTIWMAASALLLRAAEGGDLTSLVTRAGGNGERFGIALAGSPDHWICVDATPPQGRMMGSLAPDTVASNAIGDSAVIDMLGLGGQAMADASEPLQVLQDYLPADHATLAKRLLAIDHPVLGRRVAVNARNVVTEQAAPLIALAMQAADGRQGFAGRGVYRPPIELFERAVSQSPQSPQ